jgi:hypothetical protein
MRNNKNGNKRNKVQKLLNAGEKREIRDEKFGKFEENIA